VISGLLCEVDESSALLGCDAACSQETQEERDFYLISLTLKMGPIGCSETSVMN